MRSPGIELVETTLHLEGSRLWKVSADECPDMATFRLARYGIDQTQDPYRRVRMFPGGSFILACLGGEGRILLEGRWQMVLPGEVIMAPPRVLNAFYTPTGKTWDFAWLRYEEPPSVRPLVGATSPLRLGTGAEDLGFVLTGLRAEWEKSRDRAMLRHWINLAHGHACRLAGAWRGNESLWQLWQDVSSHLEYSWSLPDLAAKCYISTEQLRRTCQRELGRSPMEHLTFMRMQRAQEILDKTDDKIETIARLVGYSSAEGFSRSFARCIGAKPSEYRSRR